MSKMVKIEMTDHGRGTVTVDGVELKEVRSVAFKFAAGDANVVTVELYTKRLEVAGVADLIEHKIPVLPASTSQG